ncbi:MAG: HupE/UreJ family protein [Proteobacteria bacterium]|nr:HupE/UreJ family protein [Pseudomonadota bacterium]
MKKPVEWLAEWLAGWLVLLILISGSALAHEIRPAYLQMSEIAKGEFEVLWKMPVVEDRRLPLEPVLPDECTPTSPVTPTYTGAALLNRWNVACSLRAGSLHISGLSRTLTDVMVVIDYLNGDRRSQLLRAEMPSLDLTESSPGIWGYLNLGIEHLLFGIDHVLFVIGLVLYIKDRWALLKTVTAFTLAHSITLALSVLDLVRLSQGVVEAVIALSIVFLARELMLDETRRSPLTRDRPWLMAMLFGLLHGFGFAGALADIGLPADQLATSLLLFNVGIEIGQLMVIAVVLAALALGARLLSLALAERVFIIVTGVLAGFWTIDRIALLV